MVNKRLSTVNKRLSTVNKRLSTVNKRLSTWVWSTSSCEPSVSPARGTTTRTWCASTSTSSHAHCADQRWPSSTCWSESTRLSEVELSTYTDGCWVWGAEHIH
jgi:hypothetical protein